MVALRMQQSIVELGNPGIVCSGRRMAGQGFYSPVRQDLVKPGLQMMKSRFT